MNRKIFKNPLIVLMMVVCLAFSVLVCRLFYLQIIKGEEYAQEFELKIRKTQTIKATRGKIYDRNGNLLAYNELAYSVTIEDPTTSDQSRGERNKIINGILEQVRDIVTENGDSVISSFGIILDSSGNYQFSQNSETQRLRFVADVYGYASADDLSEEQRNQTADKITDSSGSLIRDNEADILDSMDEISDSTWDLVQSGMEEMVNNSSTFTDIDFTMAGKTGTAQQSALYPDHALFVGYAPVDDPQISVAVRIAYGYSSSYAAEIGRDIARLWLEPDSADEVITGKAAELGEAQSGD